MAERRTNLVRGRSGLKRDRLTAAKAAGGRDSTQNRDKERSEAMVSYCTAETGRSAGRWIERAMEAGSGASSPEWDASVIFGTDHGVGGGGAVED